MRRAGMARVALALGTLLTFLLAHQSVLAQSPSARANPIAEENRRAGTTRWKSPELSHRPPMPGEVRPGGSTSQTQTWTDTPIRGYAGRSSINRGDAVSLYVS